MFFVNSNVIVSAIPTRSKLHADVYAFAKGVSEHLLPRTTAYHEIWLDKKLVAGEALKDVEPLYSEFYLPRKVRFCLAISYFSEIDKTISSKSPFPFLPPMMSMFSPTTLDLSLLSTRMATSKGSM